MFAQPNRLLPRRYLRIFQLCIISICLVAAIALPRLPSVAQSIRQAIIVEVLDKGKGLVFIQGKRVKEKDIGKLREQIQTAAKSRAGIHFGEIGSKPKAGVRLDQNSSLIVGDECISLFKGKVLISGNTGKLGCVGKISIRPMGTVYIMEVGDSGQGQIVVLEGKVEIFNSDASTVKLATLSAGQQIQTDAVGTVGAPQTLTQAQLQAIAAPLFDDFEVSLPGLERVAIARPMQGFTTFLGEALTGGDTSFEDFDGQKGRQSFVIRGASVEGIFFRDSGANSNTGSFTPSSSFTPIAGGPTIPAGTAIPITVDFNARTIRFNKVPLQTVDSSLGLSGNGAAGTAIYPNGQAIRIEVRDVGVGKEPPPNSSFPGRITAGTERDR